ncbi:MAG: metallo-dependent hydrolase [Negativicutes bacterium]|nr:metallo-dependent hydrolase [Negativicutes bacterium]
MNVDIRIAGGTVIDPERGLKGPGEVLIKGNQIVSPAQGEAVQAERTIDAEGCLVLPGLIDFHTHLFAGGSEMGIYPDTSLLPMGVTTAVDAGSCGTANFESFYRMVVATSRMRIFSFLNVCPAGLLTSRYHEEVDPKYYDEAGMEALFNRYPGQLLGLKIRQSKDIVGDLGCKPLEAAVAIAQRLACPVSVHTSNPPVSAEQLVSLLRPGDIYCHVHQGTGETILDPDGKVRPAMVAAQKAGIIFDAANGRNHFSVKIAQPALAQSFFPDVISTDVTSRTVYGEFAFALPYVMMKYLNMGMALEQVIAACTSTPARLMGRRGKIGTLAPGAFADVAVFRPAEKPVAIKDNFGNSITGNQWLLPQLTIADGKIAYRQIDFSM